MKEKKSKQYIAVVIVIILFYIYFNLVKGEEVFRVEFINDEGNIMSFQKIDKTGGTELVQAIMDTETNVINLNSKYPVTPDSNIAIFRAVAKNPFEVSAELEYIEVLINGVTFSNEPIQKLMNNYEEFIYKTEEIDLAGNDGQKNNVKIKFMFKALNGDTKTVDFNFDYMSLTPCNADNDCTGVADKCDLNNVARFSSKAADTFCTRQCNEHKDCWTGQICIQGYCGY